MTEKRYKCGLVVGKFSPFHKGHHFLIQSAIDQCDDVVVISYSRPEFPSCSAAVREGWISSAFPSVKVLSIDAATIETWRCENDWIPRMPMNDDADVEHRNFTYQLLALKLGSKVDAVFTSEEYGDGFADFLSDPGTGFGSKVQHVCIDLQRSSIPVSGSALRNTNNQRTGLIDESVERDFAVKKVCVLGGESTGKSTLTKLLSQHLKDPLVEEYGRELWEEKNGLLTPDDLQDICQVQIRNEDFAQRRADRFVFCDTSPLTTLCYSEALFQQRFSAVAAHAERPYHFLFLCEPDFPFMQDGTRRDEAFRLWQHNWYLAELSKRNIVFETLGGDLNNRLNKVTSLLMNDAG